MSLPTLQEYNPTVAHTLSAAGCFCLHNRDVLMIQRQRHKPFPLHWAVPTGKLDSDESPILAARRELMEEVGIDSEVFQLEYLSDTTIIDGNMILRYTSFILRLSYQPHLEIRAAEVRKAEWVPLEKIRKRRVVPFFWDMLQQLKQRLGGEGLQLKLIPTISCKRYA